MMILNEHYNSVLRNAFASCALLEATDPHRANTISEYLGQSHEPITRERVARVLGENAAQKWEELIAARRAFLEAAE